MKPAFCLPILFLLSACRPEAETVDTAAPTARKPSYYESEKRQTAVTPVKTQVPALSAIKSQADFDLLSRIYEQGNEYEIPHILFLIDREAFSSSIVKTITVPTTSILPNFGCMSTIWLLS